MSFLYFCLILLLNYYYYCYCFLLKEKYLSFIHLAKVLGCDYFLDGELEWGFKMIDCVYLLKILRSGNGFWMGPENLGMRYGNLIPMGELRMKIGNGNGK